MTRNALVTSLLMLCFFISKAQNDPTFFKELPINLENTPEWAKMMYSDHPNVYQVDEAYFNYYNNNPFLKSIHTQNYKHWRRQIEPYIQENGKIQKPNQKEEDAYYQNLRNKHLSSNQARPSNSWRNLGPFETYKAGTLTPYSNQVNVYSIDQSKSNSNILYCGTESSGVFKTIDKGNSWELLTHGEVFVGGLTGIEIHPNNPDSVFVAGNSRLYLTTDGGVNWNEMFYFNGSGYEIKFVPDNHKIIFLVSSRGLYKSTDKGANWTQIFTEECFDLDFHPTNPDTVYLLKENNTAKRAELFRSVDKGTTWALEDNGYYVPTDPANAGVSGGKIGVSPANPNLVYVGLIGSSKANDNGWIGVYKSLDRGATWSNPVGQDGGPYQQANTMPWNIAAYSSGYHQGFYNFDLEVSPLNENVLWIGTVRLVESIDGAVTFQGIAGASSTRTSDIHADVQAIEVNGSDIWVATDGGIDYSTDLLQSHVSKKNGIAGSNFWGFGSGWNEDALVGGRYHNGNSGYYQTYAFGASHKIGGVEEATGYIHPMEARKAYFSEGWNNRTVTKRLPEVLGSTITSLSNVTLVPNESYGESNTSGVYFHPTYADHMYMGKGSKIWKSSDAGITFQALHDFGTDGRVLEIEFSRSNNDSMFLVFKPYGTNARQIHRSADGGLSWQVCTNVPTNNRNKLEITSNPSDGLELWVLANDGNNGNKVFKTLDGGTSWINMTTNTLDGEHGVDIFYQGGTDDVVYIVTRNTVYYYDKNSTDWIDYGQGLPLLVRPRSMRPFYRDSLIRIATGGRGIWERSMVVDSKPIAQPITYSDSIFCSRDTVQLDCYSILHHESATWSWTITPSPSYISSTNSRNPKVVFGNNGAFDIALTVTDADGDSDTKSISDMIVVESKCDVDTIPGNALNTVANGDYLVIPEVNLSNITHFTGSAWIKPKGAQQAFSGIFSSGDWCAHCDYTEGLVIDYHGSKLWYKWPGTVGWAGNSGMTVPLDEWSYVAMVVTPDSVVLYLNEQKFVSNTTQLPGDITNLFIGYGHYSKSFKGTIDEVSIWDRALSEAEIQELRHLTKDQIIPNDPGLIAYYQFNESIGSAQVLDRAGSYHGNLSGNASLIPSAIPVGSGSSERIAVNSSGEYIFSSLNAKMTFDDCSPPDGNIVLTEIHQNPQIRPNINTPGKYWVVNYYGNTSSTYSYLDSLILDVSTTFNNGLTNPEDAILYHRSVNSDSSTWAPKAKASTINGALLEYNRSNHLSTSHQLCLTDGGNPFNATIPISKCEADTIPGKSLVCTGTSDYVQTPDFNYLTDTLTISAWVKPNGIQNDYAAIMMNDGTVKAGLNFREGNNTLGYHWPGGSWSFDSNLEVPANEWSHVAMVARPNSITLYLNGIPVTHNRNIDPAQLSTQKIGSYNGWSSRNYKGEIDEVCVWKRPLSTDEIRSLMHLTKENAVIQDTSLIAYYQFNDIGATIYDKSGSNIHSSLVNNAQLSISTAPIGGGSSEMKSVFSGGLVSFPNAQVKLGFPNSGTYPDGDLWIYRLNVLPDQQPSSYGTLSDGYWVIRNFGINDMFSILDSITFTNLSPIDSIDEDFPGSFSFFKRESNDFGNTWNSAVDVGDRVSRTSQGLGDVTFSNGNITNSFSQFIIEDTRGIRLSAKIFLEGSFNGINMRDSLRRRSLLPFTEPYSTLGFTHRNGGGGEICTASVFNITGNDAIIDWILVELRDKNDNTKILYTRSALLQADGDVVDIDGTSPLYFDQAIPDDYYVAIRHRNHLGIMSHSSLSLSSVSMSLDFTNPATNTYGTNALKNVSGTMLMYAGNANFDSQINAVDLNLFWRIQNGQAFDYLLRTADFNLDGAINAIDKNLFWSVNNSVIQQLP